MKLVIFDLDQTLVDLIALHDETMLRLFRQFFGVEAQLTEIDFAGSNLSQNFIDLAKLKNIPEDKVRQNLPAMLKRYQQAFIETIPRDMSPFVLPGARELLQTLMKTDNVVVLYTGSPPDIMRKVLQVSGLAEYFKWTFSGTDVARRSDMVREAIKKSEELTGRKFSGKDIVIIGDSVRDVECGQEFDALTISVATGFHTIARLAQSKPDYIFDSLKDIERILKAIEEGVVDVHSGDLAAT